MALPYTHLFFDLDHTLWDFDANARLTLEQLYRELSLKERGIEPFEAFYLRYIYHNERLWERYRKGFLRRDDLRFKRMFLTLLDFKVADESLARRLDEYYVDGLPYRTLLFPQAVETLQYLRDAGYRLHLITNGFEATQHMKLRHCGIDHFFGEVITSEGSQSLKPNKAIFDYALLRSGAALRESIMLGDDPEVDIAGARNAGMDQVLINHKKINPAVQAMYTVESLQALQELF